MKTAQQLFDAAFDPATCRDPRSPAYKAGVLAALKFRLKEATLSRPYRVGTAECDAWFAGSDEGFAIYARTLEDGQVAR